MPNFVAIDFETATSESSSACAVGIVTVEQGIIVDQYYTLIQPPDNLYSFGNINCHGITPDQTRYEPTFDDIYPAMAQRLANKKIVAHNESFDRKVLKQSMAYYALYDQAVNVNLPWVCTCRIYRGLGYRPASLNACCAQLQIKLNHHNALSDAHGCALLYLNHLKNL
jgi:DNA polymerase-3 subunit epsilon